MTRPETSAPGSAEPLLQAHGPTLDAIGLSFSLAGLDIFRRVAPPGTRIVPSTRSHRNHRMACKILDAKGRETGALMHNGPGEPHGHILITGPASEHWFKAVKNLDPACRVTRRDEAWDFPGPGAYERLMTVMLDAKTRHKVKSQPFGDADFPDDGRTLYLGWGSPCKVRLYERHKHPDHRHTVKGHVTRLEIEVRPQGIRAQAAARDWEPGDAWGARAWTRELGQLVLGISAVPVRIQPPGTATDNDKFLWNLVARSGKRLAGAAKELGGWDQLGLGMKELFEEHCRRQARR